MAVIRHEEPNWNDYIGQKADVIDPEKPNIWSSNYVLMGAEPLAESGNFYTFTFRKPDGGIVDLILRTDHTLPFIFMVSSDTQTGS